jgi:S-adenosylmethionine decarboxylase proenzyme
MKALGYHTLIELYGCNSEKINDTELVENTLLKAAQIANLSVVNTTIHHFNPIGVSGVIVIKESHIAVHTWPEHDYVALDFFTCNASYELKEAIQYIKVTFEADKIEKKEITRGEKVKTINEH